MVHCAECDKPPKVIVPAFHNGNPVVKFWIGCCSALRTSYEWNWDRACLAWNYRNMPAEVEDSYIIDGDAT